MGGQSVELTMPNLALPHPLAQPWSGLGRLAGQTWHLIVAFQLALRVRRERRLLATLDARTLKDIGYDRGDAGAEAHRSFWDLPVNRLRS
jgi:uncharacterized protein YjiS (DUF1127 family)